MGQGDGLVCLSRLLGMCGVCMCVQMHTPKYTCMGTINSLTAFYHSLPLLVCVCVSVCIYVCVNVGAHKPQHESGGQWTTLDVGPQLPLRLKQDGLFVVHCYVQQFIWPLGFQGLSYLSSYPTELMGLQM